MPCVDLYMNAPKSLTNLEWEGRPLGVITCIKLNEITVTLPSGNSFSGPPSPEGVLVTVSRATRYIPVEADLTP